MSSTILLYQFGTHLHCPVTAIPEYQFWCICSHLTNNRPRRPALQLPAALSPRRIELVRGTCERCLQDSLCRACGRERCFASAQSKLRGGNRSAGRRADRCRLCYRACLLRRDGNIADVGWLVELT